MAVVHLCILALFVASTKSTSMYNMYSNMIMLDGKGNYNVSYKYNESADTLQFMVQVRTAGWVGFGVAEKAPNGMMYYDVAIGGVTNNGTSYLQDYLTVRQTLPRLDTQQDWMLMNAMEENSITTIKFYRMRNTTDLQNDTAIPKGKSIYIVWAYHPMSDKLQQHGNESRGFYNVTLIPVITPTTTIMMAPSTAAVQPVLHSDNVTLNPVITPTTTIMMAPSTAAVQPVLHSDNVTLIPVITPTTTIMMAPSTAVVQPVLHSDNVTLIPVITPTPIIMMEPSTAVVQPVRHSDLIMLDGKGNYNVSYYYNAASDKLEFMVQVRTTGWVGFGVAEVAPNMMNYYDVAIGGVTGNGTSYLQDYLTVGQMQPRLDTQQDWMLMNASEENNVTTLKFYRMRNTTDLQNDTAIPKGMPIYIVWAYHPMSDKLQKHGNESRGFYSITLVPGMTPTTPMTMTPTVTLVPAGVTPTTQAPTAGKGLFPHSFDSGNFLMQWTFDDQSNKLTFHVKVKTTGWVGFGFAKVAPAQMMNYDVVVGGYDNGGYLEDYYTQEQSQPKPDRQNNDYELLSASEEGGYTELMFERTTNTNDDQDIQFVPGSAVHIIWAYGAEDVTSADSFVIHSSKGFSSNQLVIIPTAPVPTQPGAASSLHSLIYVIVSLAAILFNVVEI